ncbi:MAG: hypothetical protein JXR49_14900 [Acidobacteria bacterium]|nr:hypothetical protein [Acidobacteriota bacterium]
MKDQKYDNFPDDANKPMENLITRGFATGTPDELFFSKDGLLMADVIFDIDDGKGWRYGFWYYLIWVLVICGAVIAIGSAINIILSPLLGWLIGSDS